VRSASLGKHPRKTSNQKRPRVLVRFSLCPADLLGKGAKTLSGFTGARFGVFTRLFKELSVLISC